MEPFTPEEAEFLAENTKIDIIPSGSMAELDLISESIPVMHPARRVSVPLWLAINLRKSTNCQIVPPDWFNVERLSLLLDQETKQPDEYQPVPFHYIEIAAILIDNIPNLPDGEQIRRLVQCIREARFKKTAEGLRNLDGNPLKINLLSFMEINEIRPFLLGALDKAARLSALERAEKASQAPSSYLMDPTKTLDSQPLYSNMDDVNPYSEVYNPYAFSTSQQ